MRNLGVAMLAIFFSTAACNALAQDGQFFVNGNVGQSNFSAPSFGATHKDNSDTYGALRFGYAWQGKFDYGVEAGYADLGQMVRSGTYTFTGMNGEPAQAGYRQTGSARGWLLGGNLKYHFDSPWYLSARGGWFVARTNSKFGSNGELGSSSQTNSRPYFGLGAGYDLTRSFSVGAGYDYYNLGDSFGHVNAYSVSAEFRF